jgi:hypothetical protein
MIFKLPQVEIKNFIENDWEKVSGEDIRSLKLLSITNYSLLQI